MGKPTFHTVKCFIATKFLMKFYNILKCSLENSSLQHFPELLNLRNEQKMEGHHCLSEPNLEIAALSRQTFREMLSRAIIVSFETWPFSQPQLLFYSSVNK